MSLGATYETTYVKQFASNVYHLSQQKESRLKPFVKFDSFIGEGKFYDRIGETEVYEKTGRYSDTKWVDVEWSRRRLNFRDYRWAHPVDQADKLRLIHNPESEVALAARYAFGRKMDEIIVGAGLGTSFAGKEGTVGVDLADSNKVGATDGSNFSSLTVESLRLVRQKFWENESIMSEGETIHLVCTSSDLINMLREDEAVNADYAAIKALVNGEINTFMGFQFHRIEFMPQLTSAISTHDPADGSIGAGGAGVLPIGSKRLLAFVKDGIQMALNEDVMARIDERPDKDYLNQVYMKMAMGGVRMEEEKVVELITKA